MIIDANVATYWCVQTPLSSAARGILHRSDLIAPGFIRIEVTHALFKYLRAGMITYALLRDGITSVRGAIVEFVGKAARGELKLPIAEVFPLEQAAEAAEASNEKGRQGKIAIRGS